MQLIKAVSHQHVMPKHFPTFTRTCFFMVAPMQEKQMKLSRIYHWMIFLRERVLKPDDQVVI